MSEQKLREGLEEIQIKHPYALESYFAVVVDRITEKFHVRLTDDGEWEWIE